MTAYESVYIFVCTYVVGFVSLHVYLFVLSLFVLEFMSEDNCASSILMLMFFST